MKKEKMYITKKEGNSYYFRFYGDSVGNTPGVSLEIGEGHGNLVLGEGEELQVGDYVEGTSYERKDGSWGYNCHKKTPTEKDIKANKLTEDYINAIAENIGPFFAEVLAYGRQKILESGDKKKYLVYSDKQLETLVKGFVSSLKTYGVSGGMGSGLFPFYLQLSNNNLFGSFKEYNKILGTRITSFDIEDYPTCVPKQYAKKIYFSGSCGHAYSEDWPQSYSIEFGECEILIKIYTDKVVVEKPYIPGSFKAEMDAMFNETPSEKPMQPQLKQD